MEAPTFLSDSVYVIFFTAYMWEGFPMTLGTLSFLMPQQSVTSLATISPTHASLGPEALFLSTGPVVLGLDEVVTF